MPPGRAAKLGLLFISAVLSLAGAEILAGSLVGLAEPWRRAPEPADGAVCRDVGRFDDCTGWWLKPNLNCVMPHEGRAVWLRTNGEGLRAEKEYTEKRPGIVRVGAFGDSYTFGTGVEADETYAALLEKRFDNVEVLNFGLGGGGPDQSLLALRCKAARFDLDVLIIAPTVENVVRILMTERDGRLKPYFTLSAGGLDLHNYPVPLAAAPVTTSSGTRPLSSYVSRSALGELALPVARAVALRLGVYQPFRRPYSDPATSELMHRILTGFRAAARRATLIYAPLPTYHYIEYGIAPDYAEVFRRSARDAGGVYVDLLPAFKRLTARERRATRFRYDQHYSPLAHKVVAEALAPYVAHAGGRLRLASGADVATPSR